MYSSLLGVSAKKMTVKQPQKSFCSLLSKEEKHFPAGFTDTEGHKGGQFAPKDAAGEAETKEKPVAYSDGKTSLLNSMAVNKPKEIPDVSPEDLVAHHKAGLEKSAKLLDQYIKVDGGKPTDTNAKILAGNIANHVDALTDLGGMSKEELAKGLSTQGLSMWLKKKHGLPLTAQEEKNIASTMKSAISLQNKKQAAKKIEDYKKLSAQAEEAKTFYGEDSAQYKILTTKATKALNKAMSYGVLPPDAAKVTEEVKENHDVEKVAQLQAIQHAAAQLAHFEHFGTQSDADKDAVTHASNAANYLNQEEIDKAIQAGKDANQAKVDNGKNLLSLAVIAHAQVQHQQHEAKDSDAYKEYKDAANSYKYYYNAGAADNGLNKDDLKESVKSGKLAFSSMKANKNMEKVVPPAVPVMEKLAPTPKPALEVKPEPPKTFADISAEAKAKDGLQKLVDLTTSYNAHMTLPNNQTYYSDFLEAKKNLDTEMGVGYSDKALAAYYVLKNKLVDDQAKDKETQVEPKTFADFVNDSKAKGNTGKLAYMTNAYSDHKSAPTPDTQAMLNGAKASLDDSMGAGYSDKAIAAYDEATTPKQSEDPYAKAQAELAEAVKDPYTPVFAGHDAFFKALGDHAKNPLPLGVLNDLTKTVDATFGVGTGNQWLKEFGDNAAKAKIEKEKEADKQAYLQASMSAATAEDDAKLEEMIKANDAKYGKGTSSHWVDEKMDEIAAKDKEAAKQGYFKAIDAAPDSPTGDTDPKLMQMKKDIDKKYGDGTVDSWVAEKTKGMHADNDAVKENVKASYLSILNLASTEDGHENALAEMHKNIDAKYGAGTATKWITENIKAVGQAATEKSYNYGKQDYNLNDTKADALAALRVPTTTLDKSDLLQTIIDKAKADIDLTSGVKYAGLKYLNANYTDHSKDNPKPVFSNFAKEVATKLLVDAQAKAELPDLASVTEVAAKKLTDLKQDVDKYMGQGASADLLDSYDEAKEEYKKYFFSKIAAVQDVKANAIKALALGMHINKVDELFGKGTSSQWADEFNATKGATKPADKKPADQKAEDKKIYINSYIANMKTEHNPIEKAMYAKYGIPIVNGWVDDFDGYRKTLQGKYAAYLANPSPETLADENSTKKTIDAIYGGGTAEYCITGKKPAILSPNSIIPLSNKLQKDKDASHATADTSNLLDSGKALESSDAKIRDLIIFANKVKEYNALNGEGSASSLLAATNTTGIPSDATVDQQGKTAAECKKVLCNAYDNAIKANYATNQVIPIYAETAKNSFGLNVYNYWLAQHIEQKEKTQVPPLSPIDTKEVKAATAKMKKSVLVAAKALIANPTSPEHAAKFSSTLSDADAKYGNGTALKWIGAANKKEAKASGDSVSALSLPKELSDVIAAGDKASASQKTAIPKLPDVLPTDKTEAESLNDKLGMAYYTIRHENGGDKNAPDVLSAYKVWDTLKNHMKANLGYDSAYFSSTSGTLNSNAQAAWNGTGQALQDKKEKATSDYVDSVAAWGAEAAKKNVDPDKEDYLKDMMVTNAKVAVDTGVPANTLGTLFDAGKANSAAFVKKQKDAAMKEIAAASHDYFMKSGLKGDDDPETKAANMNALNIMAKHSMLLSEAERIDAFGRSKGSAEKAIANLKLLGDLGAVAQKYDSGEITCNWCPKGSESYEKVKEVGEALWTSFTPKQQAAFKDYTGSGHSSANKSLASGSGNNLAETLSKAMDGQSLGIDMKLRRNMPQKWFWKAMGLPYSDDRKEMNSLTDEQLLSCVGKVYREPALSSASYDENNTTTVTSTGDQSGYANLRIRAAKDVSQGAWLDYHSGCPSEREILLNKGATYLIRGIERDDSNYQFPYKIDMDLIGYTEEPKK